MKSRMLMMSLLLCLALVTPALAASDGNGLVLGKGVNLAHWISQTKKTGSDRVDFITEADIQHIADMGFDHVRLPMDEKQMWSESGARDDIAFGIMHDAIRWSLERDLKVVVDLHILRSHHFNAEEKPLWTEPAEQERFIGLWQDLSSDLAKYPVDSVVYELMNEPVADDPQDWNRLVARALAAVRELEPERVVMIGSNRWQHADTFDELAVPDDDNLILSYHFYEPFLLTHYGTRWTRLRDYDGPVQYPGVILEQEAFDALPAGQREAVAEYAGRTFNREVLLEMMEKPLRVARETGLPLYCGEYGVFDAAPAEDRAAWFEDMLAIFEAHGVSSAVWNYKSDQFGIIGLDGKPTALHRHFE